MEIWEKIPANIYKINAETLDRRKGEGEKGRKGYNGGNDCKGLVVKLLGWE
jgi:hypothetical protein